jgi:hypothetical protein
MTLGDIVRRTGTEHKTLRACNVSGREDDVDALREYFDSQDLSVRSTGPRAGAQRGWSCSNRTGASWRRTRWLPAESI